MTDYTVSVFLDQSVLFAAISVLTGFFPLLKKGDIMILGANIGLQFV